MKVEIEVKDLSDLYRDANMMNYYRTNLENAKAAAAHGTFDDVKKELGL